MAISLTRLLAFEGPNRYSPQPAVLLQFSCDTDYSTRLRQYLKDAAQRVGVILAYLEVAVVPQHERFAIELRFTSPTPRLGAALGQYLLAAIQAEEQDDQLWDADEQLWLLQKRRRAEALPLPALQLLAEAHHRGIPAFQHTDQTLQIGYGIHGLSLPIRPSSAEQQIHPEAVGVRGAVPGAPSTVALPWADLGPIPLIVFSGHPQASAAAATAFQAIQQGRNGQQSFFQPESRIELALAAGFDRVRALLAEPSLGALVLALAADDLATRGLPFTVCRACVIVGLPALNEEALEQIVGLPMLVTEANGIVALDADTPAIAALSDYAPCPVVLFSQSEAKIAQQRTLGRKVVFERAGSIVGAVGGKEQLLATPQPTTDRTGQLAAWAIWWGMNG